MCGVDVTSMLMPGSQASSHHEVPSITTVPKVDAIDLLRSKANCLSQQDPYGRSNYFTMAPDALKNIKVDNVGEAHEDVAFRFRFDINRKEVGLPIDATGNRRTVTSPVINLGVVGTDDITVLNVEESENAEMIRDNARRCIESMRIANMREGSDTLAEPPDNSDTKSIPNDAAHAASHAYDIETPGCHEGGMFVGQRKDSCRSAVQERS